MPGDYLLDALFEAGPVRAVAEGGERTIDWPEALAYATATAALGEPWEMRALMRMAQAYLRGKIDGRNPLSIPPLARARSEP